MHLRILTLLCLIFILACSGDSSQESAESAGNKAGDVTPSANQTLYKVTPFSPSQAYTDAEITAMSYENGTFNFQLAEGEYQLGAQTPDAPQKNCANSGQGQHIHLIVDNFPYLAKYESQFDHEMIDGQHFILAFLSRSYHESIKTDKAHVAIDAMVTDNTIRTSTEVTQPMLFYSRPKGIYEGEDTKRVMLDYYMVNADDANFMVEADINGEKHLLEKWQPYYVEGLPAGDNSITLTLVDKEGNRVRTDLNPVTRRFVLNPEPAVQ